VPKAALKAPALANAGFHDAGYDALVTGSTLLSLIDIFGVSQILLHTNIIRDGGRTIYKHYCLDGSSVDHVPATRYLFQVTSNLKGVNNPAAKLGADMKAFSGRGGVFSQGCKTDIKNGHLMVMFNSQHDVDLFNGSTKFGQGFQGKAPNYTLHQVHDTY
jgi:hypothetical protein